MTTDNFLDTTVDQWCAALKPALTDFGDPGETTVELSHKLGMPATTLARRLRQMVEDGKCKVGRGKRLNSSGRIYSVKVFQLLTKK